MIDSFSAVLHYGATMCKTRLDDLFLQSWARLLCQTLWSWGLWVGHIVLWLSFLCLYYFLFLFSVSIIFPFSRIFAQHIFFKFDFVFFDWSFFPLFFYLPCFIEFWFYSFFFFSFLHLAYWFYYFPVNVLKINIFKGSISNIQF